MSLNNRKSLMHDERLRDGPRKKQDIFLSINVATTCTLSSVVSLIEYIFPSYSLFINIPEDLLNQPTQRPRKKRKKSKETERSSWKQKASKMENNLKEEKTSRIKVDRSSVFISFSLRSDVEKVAAAFLNLLKTNNTRIS